MATPREVIESAETVQIHLRDEIAAAPVTRLQCTPLLADAILKALDAAGFVIVPKEPTAGMIMPGTKAYLGNYDKYGSYRSAVAGAYGAMIAASQKQESTP